VSVKSCSRRENAKAVESVDRVREHPRDERRRDESEQRNEKGRCRVVGLAGGGRFAREKPRPSSERRNAERHDAEEHPTGARVECVSSERLAHVRADRDERSEANAVQKPNSYDRNRNE